MSNHIQFDAQDGSLSFHSFFLFHLRQQINNLKGQPISKLAASLKPISKLAEASKWVSWAVYIASTLHMYCTRSALNIV